MRIMIMFTEGKLARSLANILGLRLQRSVVVDHKMLDLDSEAEVELLK